jgi:hypothetical protein
MKYYCDKYGFEVTETETSYDYLDELTEPFYFMQLDLSKIVDIELEKKLIKTENKKMLLEEKEEN